MILRRESPYQSDPLSCPASAGRQGAAGARLLPCLSGVVLAFQESFNRFPGFSYEVHGVFQERVNGRIEFHTYVVRE